MIALHSDQMQDVQGGGFCQGFGVVSASIGMASWLGLMNPISGTLVGIGLGINLGCAIYDAM